MPDALCSVLIVDVDPSYSDEIRKGRNRKILKFKEAQKRKKQSIRYIIEVIFSQAN